MASKADLVTAALMAQRGELRDTPVDAVGEGVTGLFGMDPMIERLDLFPRHDPQRGWVAPKWLYQAARAAASPGVAGSGREVSPADAVNFAGVVGSGGIGASAVMRNAAPGPGKTLPMTVYHGSPHNFDAFDLSKIGTGEGAQAYGHGLYVAEKPGVAKTYMGSSELTNDAIDYVAAVVGEVPREKAAEYINQQFTGSVLKQRNPYARPITPAQSNLVRQITNDKSLWDDITRLNTLDDSSSAWHELYANIYGRVPHQSGTLYHVDLPDQHIANMLDWDKPLSQQPANVQAAFKRRITEPKAIDGMDMGGNARLRDNRNRQADPSQVQPWVLETQSANGTSRFGLSQKDVDRLIGGQDVSQLTGAQIYQRMAAEHGGFPQASEMMKNLGIPGIKYLDGGSRAAGNGTRNYVVFDDKLLKILKKE